MLDLGRFKKQHGDFFLRHGPMLHAARHDQKLSFVKRHAAVAKLHSKRAVNYQKKFIFIGVAVPDELAFELDQLDVLSVQFAHNARIPMIVYQGKFFVNINFFSHSINYVTKTVQVRVKRS